MCIKCRPDRLIHCVSGFSLSFYELRTNLLVTVCVVGCLLESGSCVQGKFCVFCLLLFKYMKINLRLAMQKMYKVEVRTGYLIPIFTYISFTFFLFPVSQCGVK